MSEVKMSHTEVFNKWYSERMGHPFAVQLGKSAVDELQQENAALKKANAWHVNHTNELHEENAELREVLVLISLNSSFQANMPHESDLIENLLNRND